MLPCLSAKCVFSAAAWERVPSEDLTREERKHISDAWLVSPERRHVDHLLDDRRLHELGFIVDLTEDRRRKVEKNLSKKSKLLIMVIFRYYSNRRQYLLSVISFVRKDYRDCKGEDGRQGEGR